MGWLQVCQNPSCIGIGLGEDTAMLVTGGNKMEAIGSGLVTIIDGHEMRIPILPIYPMAIPSVSKT
ncbi:MAG: hypothetical protein IPH68_11525 [Chitinophagaceae bacterium]|nr:hypothetical protein [Chitinophagaceae bacterium]